MDIASWFRNWLEQVSQSEKISEAERLRVNRHQEHTFSSPPDDTHQAVVHMIKEQHGPPKNVP